MKTYKLHIIRHGITSGNKNGVYVGQKNIPLCTEGINEIKEMLSKFDYPYVEKVYSSPLERCIQTADLIYPDSDKVVVENMKEIDFGDFEGKSYVELSDNEDFKKWLENSQEFAPPNGEKGEDFLKRLVVGLDLIFKDMMNSQINSAALFTHGGAIMTLFSAMGLPKHTMTEWMTPNACGYTILLTPQMWMRDMAFEVYDVIPKEKDNEEI